jgi:hypothetical protein
MPGPARAGDVRGVDMHVDPAMAAQQRQLRVAQTSEMLYTTAKVLERTTKNYDLDSLDRVVGADGRVRYTVQDPKTTLHMAGVSKGKPRSVISAFGVEGLALSLTAKGREALDAQRVQQAVIGALGTYSKRGVIQATQMETSYLDIVDKLINMTREGSSTKAMLEKRLGGELLSEMTENARWIQKQKKGAFNFFDRTMMLQGEMLQKIGIEKYRDKNPLWAAREYRDIQHALFGGKSDRFATHDAAYDALLKFIGEDEVAAWYLNHDEVKALL